ncbi:MAG: peptidase [Fibrobacteres bacterium]|nr:peptidase [Fibrobacterota bacterium]
MKAALALLLFAGLVCSPPVHAMVRMAVVFGNNTGLDDDKPLQFATRDAEQVHSALMQLGGIDKGRDYLLLDPDVSKVMSVFEDARKKIVTLRGEGQKVQLLIYYSGHGSEDALHMNGEKLALSSIREFFHDMQADLKILIADACFSGSLIQAKGAKLLDPVPVKYQDELKVNGSAILTSSSAGEFSQESKELQGSLFTHYFLTAIRGAGDADRDGCVSLWEAYNYTQAGLRRKLASVKNVTQNPEFDMDLHGSDNVVLTRVNLGQAFLALKGVPDGRYQILDGVNALQIAEVDISDPEGTVLALPRASYVVYRAEGRTRLAGYADLRKARSVVLGAGDFNSVQSGALTAKGLERREQAGWSTPANPAWGLPSSMQLEMASRLYLSFPSRAHPAVAAELSAQGNRGPWAASAAFDYLPGAATGSDSARFEQSGLGIAAEARYYWHDRGLGSFFAGPRVEVWSLEQVYNGKDLGGGRLLGTFAVVGMEKTLAGALSVSLALEPGMFWSYDIRKSMRRDAAFPMSLALRYGL